MVSKERLAEIDPKLILCDGYDHCILGLSETAGTSHRVAYDVSCIIRTLQEQDGMERTDALEYFDFNVLGAYVGDRTPAFIDTFPEGGCSYG